MGIHADAVAMADLTGKSVAECKKARKKNDAKIAKLGARTPEAMAQACFGGVAVAVAKAMAAPVSPPKVPEAPKVPAAVEKQVQEDKVEKQVADAPVVKSGIIETYDEDVIPVEAEDKASAPAKLADTSLADLRAQGGKKGSKGGK